MSFEVLYLVIGTLFKKFALKVFLGKECTCPILKVKIGSTNTKLLLDNRTKIYKVLRKQKIFMLETSFCCPTCQLQV